MSKLDGLLKQALAQRAELDFLQAGAFSTYRDSEDNLHVKFGDGRDIKLPEIIELRNYQREVRHKLFIERFRFIFLVMSRRAGKEVQSWEFLIEAAITDPGSYYMIYPTIADGRQILWDGNITFPNGEILKFVDMIPTELIHGSPNNSEMKIRLKNGSTIYVTGSDARIDKLRGRNPKGVVFSEFAFADPRVLLVVLPAIINNKGWLLLQTTFNGHNHAYQKFNEVKTNPEWYCRLDSCLTLVDDNGNRYITDDMIDAARKAGMPEWMLRQEYYCEVVLNEELLFFAREMKLIMQENYIYDFPITNDRPAYTAWDIGAGDATVMIIFQIDRDGSPRILYSHEESNKPWQYFINKRNEFAARYNLLILGDFLPHDGVNRKQETYEVGSALKSFTELQCRPSVINRPKEKAAALQLVRQYLIKSRFHKTNASRLVECLTNYSRVYDERLNMFKNEPKHDWTSHGVDSYQTMCLAIEQGLCHGYMHDAVSNYRLAG